MYNEITARDFYKAHSAELLREAERERLIAAAKAGHDKHKKVLLERNNQGVLQRVFRLFFPPAQACANS